MEPIVAGRTYRLDYFFDHDDAYRVVSFRLSSDARELTVREECDEFFAVELTKAQVLHLAAWLYQCATTMKEVDVRD